jgi:hypothetical protein
LNKVAWGVLAVCVALHLAYAARISGMLEDSDTRVLLAALDASRDPWQWFKGDWPLFNHFYRPISTAPFQFDHAVHPGDNAGFGRTNALLCAASVAALFWFVWELTARPAWAAICAALLTFWTLPVFVPWFRLGLAVAVVVLAVGIWRHRTRWFLYVPAALAWTWVAYEAAGIVSLYSRMMAWIPGRTASTMAVFALASMAMYARYERLSAQRERPRPTAEDVPATKGTRISGPVGAGASAWAWGALLCAALALGAYEQAVMLPATLLGTAILLRWQGLRVRWGWAAAAFGLLAGYLVLRRVLVPSDISGYQAQQLRTGPGTFMALADYFFPPFGDLRSLWFSLSVSPLTLLIAEPWWQIQRTLAFVSAAWAGLKWEWKWTVGGYLLSSLAYLPMAWLKPFDHYHYWPMALRTLLVVALGAAAWRATVIAVSPRAIPAPPRRHPAPGSLAHR